jgi:hypothetical protein
MLCQLQSYEDAGIEFGYIEKMVRKLKRKSAVLYQRATRAFPSGRACMITNNAIAPDAEQILAVKKLPRLHLQEGEKVRVKPYEQIRETLDAANRFQGLAFTPATMKKYCGGTYTVLKKVDRIFDERKWKLSKIKNVVLLDGVYCDGGGGAEKEWDGCDRLCFIFWKEQWLERSDE